MATNRHNIHMSHVVIFMYNIQWKIYSYWMKISDNTLESGHESLHLMDSSTINEVACMRCHKDWMPSTQTATVSCPITWIKVSRSNMFNHHRISHHTNKGVEVQHVQEIYERICLDGTEEITGLMDHKIEAGRRHKAQYNNWTHENAIIIWYKW